jgi:alkanesulfonate monooxygenase SsuD/methylene tetrahydromethanopterin reductase-like flavin-dependent oxidoreductase (luciferase family)
MSRLNTGGVLDIGVVLPSITLQRQEDLDLSTAARHAEGLGMAAVWHGDHLAIGMPTVDCAIGLATAAAATQRIRIGASVFVPAIRPLVWAAKQIASLQYVSRDRLILGIGSGGGPAQWDAAGVPYAERGRRTDTALRLLPSLLTGEKVQLAPDQPTIELAPAVTPPPFWVGNASQVAIRRAARFGDGWFPSVLTAEDVAHGATQLVELAAEYSRPTPVIAVGAAGSLGSGGPTRDEVATSLSQSYGIPASKAVSIPITGGPAQVAERLAEYHAVGARHLAMGFSGPNWREQCEVLAEARSLLD